MHPFLRQLTTLIINDDFFNVRIDALVDNKLDEGTIFGALLKQTPRSVISSCHITNKLQYMPTQGKFQKSQVRNSILVNCLAKIGCEYIENILVPCKCSTKCLLIRRNTLPLFLHYRPLVT